MQVRVIDGLPARLCGTRCIKGTWGAVRKNRVSGKDLAEEKCIAGGTLITKNKKKSVSLLFSGWALSVNEGYVEE